MIPETVVPTLDNQSLPSVGARLKQERLNQRITLEVIAAKTHIHLKHLVAIENDDLAALPEPIYVQSFLRKYAQCLELSDTSRAEILGDFESSIEKLQESRQKRKHGSKNGLHPMGLPKKIQYSLYAFLVLVVGGGLVYLNNANSSVEPAQKSVPESVANDR